MPLIVLQKKKSMTTIRTCVVIINRYTIKYNIIKILKIELQIYDRMIKNNGNYRKRGYFRWGKFRENVGKTFHVGVIFTILLLFPS